ncbi:hypothetical protein J2Z26_000046 [Bacillus luteolus]|nr:hypothetical protein [Cytobacillus luteolus]
MVITKLLLFGAMLISIKFILKICLVKVFKVNEEPYH